MAYVSEPGLYDLARRSKMPIADKFYHKVTHEVLPAIRKKGIFIDGGNPFKNKNLTASDDLGHMMILAGNKIIEFNQKHQNQWRELVPGERRLQNAGF